jgi:Icc-related predicted phosphoesterase
MELTTDLLVVMGDTHGEWGPALDAIQRNHIRDAIILHAGDVGIGFLPKDVQEEILESLNAELAERNVRMYCIRGNHDDPQYFTGAYAYSNITLMPDYTRMRINGEEFLFVGGAISIDRIKRTTYKSWWPDEVLVYDAERVTPCDVLVTHTAPNWVGPNDKNGIAYYTEQDDTLWAECVSERILMNELIEACGAKRHYCGHFHLSATAENNGCRSTILNINELLEHR